jgi:hypothetical protein
MGFWNDAITAQAKNGALTAGQQAEVETGLRQAIQTNPRLAALYQSYQDAQASGNTRMAQASLRTLNDALNERQHASYALPHDYVLKDPDALTIERLGWWGRTAAGAARALVGGGAGAAPLAAGAASGGAGGAAGGAGGAGAAGGGGAAGSGVLPSTSLATGSAGAGAGGLGAGAALPAAAPSGVAGGFLAPTAAGGGLGGFLKSPLGIMSLVGAGGDITGSLINARAAEKASKQQQEAINRALAMQGPLYDRALAIAEQQHTQGRADLQPYATAGTQGVTALTALLGLPAAAAPAAPRMTSPGGPALQPLSSVAGSGGGMVQLRAPNGQTKQVPADQAQYFVARGATRV